MLCPLVLGQLFPSSAKGIFLLERQEDIDFWKKRLGIRKRADKENSIKFDFRFSKKRGRIEAVSKIVS